MTKELFLKNLKVFIQQGTCAFTCVNYIKKIFLEKNFIEMTENSAWKNLPNTFFITRK